MEITKNLINNELIIALKGRLDSITAPALEAEISNLEGIEALTFDMAELEYISSAGLRVLLAAQKKMNAQGRMTLENVADSVMEVFEITGFSDILTIE